MLKIHSEALNPMALVGIINFYAGRGTFFFKYFTFVI